MKYLHLIILWTLWCSIHSAMISLTVVKYLKNRFGEYYKYYRIFYNLVAVITLIPLVLYSKTLNGSVLFVWEGYLIFIRIILAVVAAALFISGSLKYDMLNLLGIRQIKSGKSPSILSEKEVVDETGILGVIRHPWYLGAIIFIWIACRTMYLSTLIVNIILTIYIIIGTILEERKLIIELGDSYRKYMSKVSMLFPYRWMMLIIFKSQ